MTEKKKKKSMNNQIYQLHKKRENGMDGQVQIEEMIFLHMFPIINNNNKIYNNNI